MNDERADLHMLYQVTAQDLAYFKAQQWSLTNYSFLAYAGLVALKVILGPHPLGPAALIAVALFVAITAVALLWRLECAITVRRARLTDIRGRLSSEFNNAWGAADKNEPTYLVPIWVLTVAVAIGGALTCWALT